MKVSLIPAVFAGFATAVTLAPADAGALEFSFSRENNVLSWDIVMGRSADSSETGTYRLPAAPVIFYTGPDNGTSAYRAKYAPKVEETLKELTGLELVHGNANGTLDSIQKCAAETQSICLFLGQGNVLADAPEVKDGKICIIRPDLDPEYGYVFWQQGGILSNNFFYSVDALNSYDDVRSGWMDGSITLATSATSTGSVKTLQDLEADFETRFEGVDVKIEIAANWDAVKEMVRDNKDVVGFTFRNGGGDTFVRELQKNWNFAVAGLAEKVLADNKTFENGNPAFIFNDRAPYSESGYWRNSEEVTPALGSPVALAGNCPGQIADDYIRSVAVLTTKLLSEAPRTDFSLAPN